MIKELEIKLKQKGIRPTAMRLLVLEALSGQEAAVSLSDLEEVFEKSDRVTLYRTLKTFQENGLVHSIDDGTGAPKYALCEEGCECNIEQDLHVHFHCRMCRETFCLPKYKIPDIDLPGEFIPEEANLVVKGVCGKCSA
ncbi:Fur family transcriptional regulator, ferric uptake regulator [Sinomicrobium oceani]|uniref:Fur family transcriptional regulator, ferric uptake regulator n=1 Tax=Sinomicrobium oceani TaxID=1150368 RepID=A0A1K1MUQ9_9FLAO|nr:transcriptional repressor [Sinomicrobium oceani]SFW26932.1 Fur family transcriptional regulator, ferric uptake regulator [Sinomicrobium oceani]